MRRIRMKTPAHPGGFVKSEIIEPLGLSLAGAAQVLGVTRAALSAVLHERAHLSPEMALRIEKAFGCWFSLRVDPEVSLRGDPVVRLCHAW